MAGNTGLERLILILFILPFLTASCKTTEYQRDQFEHHADSTSITKRLRDAPQDATALRDMGILHYQADRYSDARSYLERALSIDPEDSKTVYYLGMTAERTSSVDSILTIYEAYEYLPSDDFYRPLMEGRYGKILRHAISQDRREKLPDSSLDKKRIAILPLVLHSKGEITQPLGRLWVASLSRDLTALSGFSIANHTRAEAVMKEIIGEARNPLKPAPASTIGRLLGVGRMVLGMAIVTESENVILEIASWSIRDQRFREPTRRSVPLGDLLLVSKEVLFDLIREDTLQMTAEQYRAIQSPITRNPRVLLKIAAGLDAEVQGRFVFARDFYGEALKEDPMCTYAAMRRDTVNARLQRMQSRLGKTAFITSTPALNLQLDVRHSRSQSIDYWLGAKPGLSWGSRHAAVEGIRFDLLPAPPPPPQR